MYLKDEDLNGYMNKWMDECMDTCMGRWMNGWMDECVKEGRAWGSQLSLLVSSSDTYIYHCYCPPPSHSLGPIPSSSTADLPECWWNGSGECHEDDRGSSITARLQILWEQICCDEGCKTGDSEVWIPTLLNASQAPPPGFWQRGLPTNHLALSSQH